MEPNTENTTGAVTAPPLTLGESRVRVNFNVAKHPDNKSNVDEIKVKTAEMIDFCETGKLSVDAKPHHDQAKVEAKRLWALAQTAYEEAAMWAVKAETY